MITVLDLAWDFAIEENRLRSIVAQTNAQWLGIQEGLTAADAALNFRDPVSHSSCSVYLRNIRGPEDIAFALKAKREAFRLAKTSQML